MNIKYIAAAGYDLYACDPCDEVVIIDYVAVCAPDMTAHEVGIISMSAKEIKPSMRIFPQPISL